MKKLSLALLFGVFASGCSFVNMVKDSSGHAAYQRGMNCLSHRGGNCPDEQGFTMIDCNSCFENAMSSIKESSPYRASADWELAKYYADSRPQISVRKAKAAIEHGYSEREAVEQFLKGEQAKADAVAEQDRLNRDSDLSRQKQQQASQDALATRQKNFVADAKIERYLVQLNDRKFGDKLEYRFEFEKGVKSAAYLEVVGGKAGLMFKDEDLGSYTKLLVSITRSCYETSKGKKYIDSNGDFNQIFSAALIGARESCSPVRAVSTDHLDFQVGYDCNSGYYTVRIY